MDEQSFGDRLRAALGEPPEVPNAGSLLDRAETQSGPRAHHFLVGALVGILLVGTFAGVVTAVRLSARPALPNPNLVVHPSPSPSPALQGPALPCSLPAVVERSGGPPNYSQESYGFIAVPNGSFAVDQQAAAELANEPKDAVGSGPASVAYSDVAKQWFPVQGQQVSPDGMHYAYAAYLPAGATSFNFQSSELRVYDAASRSSRSLWSSQGQVSVLIWSPSGIVVETIPKGGGTPEDWTIDQTSGKASQGTPPNSYISDSETGSLAGPGASFGHDPQGDLIAVKHSSTAAGTPYSVTVYEPSGNSFTIFSGVIGDSTGFNPFSAYRQGTSLWFTDSANDRIWLWTQAHGLQRFPLTGIPAMPSGIAHPTEFAAAVGTCR